MTKTVVCTMLPWKAVIDLYLDYGFDVVKSVFKFYVGYLVVYE